MWYRYALRGVPTSNHGVRDALLPIVLIDSTRYLLAVGSFAFAVSHVLDRFVVWWFIVAIVCMKTLRQYAARYLTPQLATGIWTL